MGLGARPAMPLPLVLPAIMPAMNVPCLNLSLRAPGLPGDRVCTPSRPCPSDPGWRPSPGVDDHHGWIGRTLPQVLGLQTVIETHCRSRPVSSARTAMAYRLAGRSTARLVSSAVTFRGLRLSARRPPRQCPFFRAHDRCTPRRKGSGCAGRSGPSVGTSGACASAGLAGSTAGAGGGVVGGHGTTQGANSMLAATKPAAESTRSHWPPSAVLTIRRPAGGSQFPQWRTVDNTRQYRDMPELPGGSNDGRRVGVAVLRSLDIPGRTGQSFGVEDYDPPITALADATLLGTGRQGKFLIPSGRCGRDPAGPGHPPVRARLDALARQALAPLRPGKAPSRFVSPGVTGPATPQCWMLPGRYPEAIGRLPGA